MGPQVVNRGTIHAHDVTLAAANGAALKLNGSKFAVELGQTARKALAANSGTITANGGHVKLITATTGALLSAVIQNTGAIEATKAASGQGGNVILGSEVEGRVSAGGRITADSIKISTDVSNSSDSYTDWRMAQFSSSGPAVRDVTVESGARLKADEVIQITALDSKVNSYGQIDGGDVRIEAFGGPVTVGNRITGRNVYVQGNGIAINAPVQATYDVTVQADPWNYYGTSLWQNANVQSAQGNVSLSGKDVTQGLFTKTSAAGDVTIQASAKGGQANVT
ncbi:Filamentous hemagglutinin-like protein [Candidatus Burkholderia humilis]|nr:Filamentous hemagglutinin-like protein [Candidatus Burkholderia humilis]